MLHPIKVRRERDGDASAIFDVVAAAFPTDAEARLVAELRARGQVVLSLVAEYESQVIGHVMVSRGSIDPPVAGDYVGIAPLSVLPDYQGQGVGKRLMLDAIQTCFEMDCDALFLLGNPSYYRRFGFETSHMANEFGATESFMHLALAENGLTKLQGTFRYAGAFSNPERP